eukprot:TRINITY_DN3545_c0_g1_i1.p1 TRINITY_DN3545_c0_g1~~TRINITY_DN3545_c0_g1_i1.p1  ORF type:complete len:617 (+),score=206.57 TRINITY_DN3545_c0_g1_i1:114-1853(+)
MPPIELPKADDEVVVDLPKIEADELDNQKQTFDEKQQGDEESAVPPAAPAPQVGGGPPPSIHTQLKEPKQLVPLMIGLLLCVLVAALDQTIVATALPAIASDFNALPQISWVVVSYLLTSTALSPLYGTLADTFGRKRTLIFALIVFMVSSLLCGISVYANFIMLVIFRAVQGVGGGGLISLVVITIADVVKFEDRAKFQGLIGAGFALASVLGPVIGGVITDGPGWQWIFYINLPIGAVAITLIGLFLDFTPLSLKAIHIDWKGSILMVSGLVLVLLPTVWGGSEYAWNEPIIIGLYCGGGALLVAFVFVELFWTDKPVVPFRLFSIRNVVLAVCICFFQGWGLIATIAFLPLFYQVVWGVSATSSGLQLLPLVLSLTIASLISGQVVARTGMYKWPIVIGSALMPLGIGLLALYNADTSLGQSIGYQIPLGLGFGMCVGNLIIAAQNSVQLNQIATITSTLFLFRFLGGSVGTAVFGTLLNAELDKRLGSNRGSDATAEAIRKLPAAIRDHIINAFSESYSRVFLYCLIVAICVPLALGMQNVLRKPPPKIDRSASELKRADNEAEAAAHAAPPVEF